MEGLPDCNYGILDPKTLFELFRPLYLAQSCSEVPIPKEPGSSLQQPSTCNPPQQSLRILAQPVILIDLHQVAEEPLGSSIEGQGCPRFTSNKCRHWHRAAGSTGLDSSTFVRASDSGPLHAACMGLGFRHRRCSEPLLLAIMLRISWGRGYANEDRQD